MMVAGPAFYPVVPSPVWGPPYPGAWPQRLMPQPSWVAQSVPPAVLPSPQPDLKERVSPSTASRNDSWVLPAVSGAGILGLLVYLLKPSKKAAAQSQSKSATPAVETPTATQAEVPPAQTPSDELTPSELEAGKIRLEKLKHFRTDDDRKQFIEETLKQLTRKREPVSQGQLSQFSSLSQYLIADEITEALTKATQPRSAPRLFSLETSVEYALLHAHHLLMQSLEQPLSPENANANVRALASKKTLDIHDRKRLIQSTLMLNKTGLPVELNNQDYSGLANLSRNLTFDAIYTACHMALYHAAQQNRPVGRMDVLEELDLEIRSAKERRDLLKKLDLERLKQIEQQRQSGPIQIQKFKDPVPPKS